jgi:hypothetical protein
MPARGAGERFLPRVPPERSPERTALREAIERHAAAVEQRDRTTAALARAREMRFRSYDAERSARAALTEAKAHEGARFPAELLAAEEALASVAVQRGAAHLAEETLQQYAAEASSAVDWAARRVRSAAVAVLQTSPAVVAALERVERLQRELVDAGDDLLWLLHHDVLTRQPGIGYATTIDDLPTRCRRAADRLDRPPMDWRDLIPGKRGTGHWEAVLAALQADPDAGIDIEIIDPVGILHARGLIDADELASLRQVERWVTLVRRARGLADGCVDRLWAQLVAGQRGGHARAAGGGTGRTAADAAWSRLQELRAAFARLDLLVALEAVVAVASGERGPSDQAELTALKAGCAGIAAYLRHGRGPERQQSA